MKINKCVFKVGDRVCDCFNGFGWGRVIELDPTLTYPISVKFDDSIQIYIYTRDGRHTVTAEIPVLSFTEYEIVKNGFSQIRLLPKIAVDTPIFVRSKGGNWYLRYFSHFNTDGQAVFFESQLKSTETKDTTTWDEYSIENPLK